MSDELELDLDENNQEEIISRKDSRIKSLSEKVKLTSEERDALKAEAEKAKAEKDALVKEAEFYKSFNTVAPKYAGASEYQDKIREKAALGLDVEEATMLVMAKEGKYVPPAPVIERENVAGGSASTFMSGNEQKTPDKMTQDERLAALRDIESQGVDLLKL